MKTIALTLIASALGFAQDGQNAQNAEKKQSSTPATAAPKPTPAQPSAKRAANSAAPAPKPKTPLPKKPATAQPSVVTVPQGATQVEPNLYRYTDSGGKTWMYRQTPFGISKWEDTGDSPQQPSAARPQPSSAESQPVAVVDLGDSVRFEKKTPFGAAQWVRKKTELTDEEKAMVAAQSESKTAEKQ